MSTTAIAISSAQSSAAMAAASAAKRRACEVMVQNFDAKGASVEAMRVYADCVDFLFPDPMSPATIIGLKVALVICFIGGAIGAWKGFEEGIVESVLYSLVGFCLTGGALIIAGLLIVAGAFVIGAV